MKTTILSVASLTLMSLLAASSLHAQAGALEQPADTNERFDSATADLRGRLDESLAELEALRAQLAEEKVPLSRELRELEAELGQARIEYQDTTRVLDQSTLDLGTLTRDIKALDDEAAYLSGLLGDYIRNFDSVLHIAERQRYEEALEAARLAPQNQSLSPAEVYQEQSQLLTTSVDRLFEMLGGTRFEGTAVDSNGVVNRGTFALMGPAALFHATGTERAGTAEERIDSLEPAELSFADQANSAAAIQLIANGTGAFPLDTTLGTAHKVAASEKTFLEEVEDGGPVMYPIFTMAGLALLVAVFKWISMAFLRRPSRKKVQALLYAVGRKDVEEAELAAEPLKGPLGRMLQAGVAHMREPRELVEEVMYEAVLKTRLKLQGLLPFIAISAASAPLMGLLGTVTGIINTFKMITIHGSGDVKSLSGGISEALITTKFGLIVAIPSLLLHAFLSRKAKRVVDEMEQTAISFANQLGKSAPGELEAAAAAEAAAVIQPARRELQPREQAEGESRELVREQVEEVLEELLARRVEQKLGAAE